MTESLTRLVIDDLRVFPGLECSYARTSTDAINMLRTERFGEAWFDHDLGGEDTAMAVVAFLEALHFHGARLPIDRAIVHTANSVGRETLHRALARMLPTTRINVFEIDHYSIDPSDWERG